MPAPPAVPDAAQATAAAAPASSSLSIAQRIRRVFPYIRHVRRLWIVVLLATAVSAATEPAVPALLKPLLDQGFQKNGFSPWMVPAALLELKDQYGVIRAQVATALPLLFVNILLIYWLAFR